MKYQCVICKSIIIVSAYKKSFKNETFNCPVCGDMMIYKPNKKKRWRMNKIQEEFLDEDGEYLYYIVQTAQKCPEVDYRREEWIV